MSAVNIRYKGITLVSDSIGKEAQYRETACDALIDKILAESNIDVPQELIHSETELRFAELCHTLVYGALQNGDYSYMYETEDDRRERRASVEQEVVRELKTERLLQIVIANEQFEVSEEELEREAEAMAQRLGISMDMVRDFLGKDLSLLKRDILKRKAMDIIYENAVF